MFEFISITLMIAYVISKRKIIGFLGWFFFGLSWLTKVPHYMEINDYYNVTIMISAFSLFSFIGLTILRSNNEREFVSVTSITIVSSMIYFVFALTQLKYNLITHTTDMTMRTADFFGFNFTRYSDKIIEYNGRYVEIILACTGIESISLFSGISLSTSAEIRRRLTAFLISVPVIYILNLLRNVFIVAAYGGEWFGDPDFSFYVAHHVISKVLATIALILISLGVFRTLPEFADLIFNLKDEVVKVWTRED